MDKHAHARESDSSRHSVGLQSPIRTPLNFSFSVSRCLSPSHFYSPSTIDIRKRALKAYCISLQWKQSEISWATMKVLIFLVHPEYTTKKAQTLQYKFTIASYRSTILISFRQTDARHGWAAWILSTTPPPTHTPGNQVVSRISRLCGVDFPAGFGWLCRESSVESPQFN